MRPVIIWPDPRLRVETKQIAEINDSVRQLYHDLVDTMYANNGLGIAAIQIGEPYKMFLVESELAGLERDTLPLVFINPEVIRTGDDTEKADEGCLSFPNVYVPVERPLLATIRAIDLNGDEFELEGEELLARCLLHENDHLTGQLLIDFVGPLKRQMIKRKLKREANQPAAH